MIYSFILVEPKVPENIGASARAIKTMGFDSLVLVNPCNDPEDKAMWLAHGSHDILDNAKVFGSSREAFKDYDLLIATTARKRRIQKSPVPVSELNSYLKDKSGTVSKVALVFGNEESGLSNKDISMCHITSDIPMAGQYPSLNLSQAVMIYAYELAVFNSKTLHASVSVSEETTSYVIIREKVKELLDEINLSENPALSGKIFERLAYLRAKDLNLIHSICNAILERIRNNKK